MNRHYTKLLVSTILISFILVFTYCTIHLIFKNKNAFTLNELLRSQLDLQNLIKTQNQIITDLDIVKCNKLIKCNIPLGYVRLNPSLSYHQTKGGNTNEKKKMYYSEYYLVAKLQDIREATKFISDIVMEQKEGYELVGNGKGGFKFYKKLERNNIESPIMDSTKVLRSVDILFGSNDLIDLRANHKTLHFTHDDSIHTILSISLMSQDNIVEQENSVNDEKHNTKQQKEVIATRSEKYKIMQISDLHFGQDLGNCNSKGIDCKSSDLKTLKFIDQSIKAEKPEIVVITGDLFDIKRSTDYKSILLKSLQPIIATGTKFVYTFGDESFSREDKLTILEFLTTLPNCLNYLPIENSLHGVTNYNFKITNELNKQSIALSVLDSEDQFIDESQINYLYRFCNNKEFFLDYKLLFFHHPLPQYRPAGIFKIIGSYNERHPLNSKTNEKYHDDIVNCSYHVVSVGHEHENDACILSEMSKKENEAEEVDKNEKKSIWLCYSSVAGDSAITKLNQSYVRKLRMFEVDFTKKRIISWKKNENDKTAFEPQLIYQKDAGS
ncbi:SIA1 [Candida oxycetoniae]|uniref:SIA1 n=1 Tax=Candida oxycetoniae TaxID=497107 RepID=A0AAI9SVJ3_9ASCO|nr:SIA1 [Candida oxycetoniae]KAI3403285.2 SIA1 [Candida oxycetoniae]